VERNPDILCEQALKEKEIRGPQAYVRSATGGPFTVRPCLERIRADTLVGMAFSNIIALAIILTAAATLQEAGVFSVETSAQAAGAQADRGRVCVHHIRPGALWGLACWQSLYSRGR
jgi:Mn2+/Fe2+ NRAMP family transporter